MGTSLLKQSSDHFHLAHHTTPGTALEHLHFLCHGLHVQLLVASLKIELCLELVATP